MGDLLQKTTLPGTFPGLAQPVNGVALAYLVQENLTPGGIRFDGPLGRRVRKACSFPASLSEQLGQTGLPVTGLALSAYRI